MTHSMGDNVRDYRRRAGLTQEELGYSAGLSPSTVRKVEQGGTVRMETLHLLARALEVETSALVSSGPPEPNQPNDGHNVRVMELRQILMPAIGFDGLSDAPEEPPNLTALHSVTDLIGGDYYADRYGKISAMLPALIRDSNSAVTYFGHGPEHEEARRIRIKALRVAGRYLTQVREQDLAYAALTTLISDGKSLGSDLDVASGISGLCWLLMTQGRFAEAAKLAVETADRIEPGRISKASTDHLAMWGWMQLRAAAGAMRNNQYDVAKQAHRLAKSAAEALGREVSGSYQGGVTFGPVTASIMHVEMAMVKGDSDSVVRDADAGALSAKARKLIGSPRPNSWHRHRLDVAMAKTRVGNHQDATLELAQMRRKTPAWLRHQRLAGDVMQHVLKKRKRTLTPEMREMSKFLAIKG
ncbi:helix-turn-helix transcriptional regulator [Streptomyces xiamenensis]